MPPKKQSPVSIVAEAEKKKKKRGGNQGRDEVLRRNNGGGARAGRAAGQASRQQKVTLHDQGMDGGNIIRNIARTQNTAQSVLGTPRFIPFTEILQSLINPSNPRYNAKVDLIDIVTCDHGQPDTYYATDPKTGLVITKAKRFTKLGKIAANFSRMAASSKADSLNPFADPAASSATDLSEEDYVAILLSSKDSSPPSLVSSSLMDQLVKSGLPADTTAILPYLEPKSGKPPTTSMYCNFRQEYKLDDLAKVSKCGIMPCIGITSRFC